MLGAASKRVGVVEGPGGCAAREILGTHLARGVVYVFARSRLIGNASKVKQILVPGKQLEAKKHRGWPDSIFLASRLGRFGGARKIVAKRVAGFFRLVP